MRDKILNSCIYLKFCWSQGMGNFSMPITIVDKAVLWGVFLKTFGITNYWLMVLMGGCAVAGILYFGHLVLSSGFLKRENGMGNRYNPWNELLEKNKCKTCNK